MYIKTKENSIISLNENNSFIKIKRVDELNFSWYRQSHRKNHFRTFLHVHQLILSLSELTLHNIIFLLKFKTIQTIFSDVAQDKSQ